MNIKLMNKIAKVGTDVFGGAYTVSDTCENPDAIMVRSAKLHDMPLNKELLAIARCGAGVNNIPVDRCAEAGVVVFNTPGANANAVKRACGLRPASGLAEYCRGDQLGCGYCGQSEYRQGGRGGQGTVCRL